ncbi:hypothetical protein K493DRAFT_311824 [Basidiobolus meristosporus CBS 931.73]|uniref:Hyaluronan/mRNA-binding protein domain-containing protein n=1 Tax=Basidiobolus meristosporus CBS 931.73 TaxID=1314790 RepID=A0A1Y1YZ21_9FUNG|nr:hypothetical protein K493DRAFT_311824 [Basidiobolus meristosporus CBS 931.73]|eukprot:ORY03199.1 hypothetical protein K493DRAFT_311824 [Basidiobolus meristosporus CBS 931.73]
MTRTKSSTSFAALTGERHFNRSGYQDPRGLPKKEGAGGYNWGRPTDEIAAIGDLDAFANSYPWEEYDEQPTRRRSSEAKINTMDSKVFESLHGH